MIHPVADPAVIAGNATIGLELIEDLPDVEAVIIPFGGGGLSCGIASAVRALKPDTKIYAAEIDTAAPLAASLAADAPREVERTHGGNLVARGDRVIKSGSRYSDQLAHLRPVRLATEERLLMQELEEDRTERVEVHALIEFLGFQ